MVLIRYHLLGALAVVLIATAWLTRDLDRPLVGDPARYAAIARTMADSGEWLEPRMLGAPYFRKPPLMLWLTAASISWLGPTSVAAALPSVLLGIALVFLLYGLVSRVLGRRAGLLVPVLLLTNTGFCELTATCRMDSLLHLSCLAAVVGVQCVRPRAVGYALFWIALGVGFLGKGPGALLVLPVLAIVSILHRDAGPFRHRAFWFSALWFLVLVVPWYAHMAAAHGSIFWEVHLGRQVVQRLSPMRFEPLVRMVGGFGFLAAIGALGVMGAALAIRGRARKEVSSGGPWDRGWWLSVCGVWALAMLAFHLVNRSGFPRYLYHALGPLSILAAYGLDGLVPRAVRARVLAGALLVIALVLLSLGGTGRRSRWAAEIEGLRAIVRERFVGPEVAYLANRREPTANFIVFYLDRTPRRILTHDLDAFRESVPGPTHLVVENRALSAVRDRGAEVLVTVSRISVVRLAPAPGAAPPGRR